MDIITYFKELIGKTTSTKPAEIIIDRPIYPTCQHCGNNGRCACVLQRWRSRKDRIDRNNI